ncbi:ATP-dependent DNA helicase [Lacimicrobium alkaliphilum]|uniref:DNA 5'-3' helicase n=1 Tax=Lacimicrobium alkaliphilum TaxID=1526571 RepID=A0ABQ1RCA4_9ALTE|nr:ATP-dependent DNA helicase [Lacimicrobium alkaliphilum]GGD63767.1 ATP-dependent helicase [Lacimicrobium alkaliphilum]
MPSVKQIFASDGALSQRVSGFVPRAEQTEMASSVEKAIKDKAQLVVEAGTGTGKTFAYLVPALASDKKVIVSTGTKNLQEQLFHRDLPIVKQALGSNKKSVLLKGRANYLCLHRLAQHGGNSTVFEKQTLHQLSQVRDWANSTKSGDMGELKSLPEDAKVLPFVTSTVDNCLGKDCPDYDDCYLVKARRNALDADMVVVNHHLFFADMALKDTGFGELIPEAHVVLFDEAHQIPDIASEYFGEALSSRQLADMGSDMEMVYRTKLKDAGQLSKAAEKLRVSAMDLRLQFPQQPQKGNWQQALMTDTVQNQISRLSDALNLVYEVLKVHLGRDKDLDSVYERCVQARGRLARLTDTGQQGVSLWYETTPRHIILHLTPLSIAQRFADYIETPKRSWIFTSATLMVDGGFEHFTGQMGLKQARTLGLESPFDYQQQALLCVPRYLPEPTAKDRSEALVNVSLELIKASQGRCFLLFTSHFMLRQVAQILEQQIDNPILVQGSTSKGALLEEYLSSGNGVLLGTSAFWEGVDVRGSDLTCVLIDKLPFAAPDDPLLEAKINDCKKHGGNPFAQIQIPRAVIALKQGAGRLIRDMSDKGVLVICDNRLVTRDYGRIFLASLPPMQRTRTLEKAVSFLQQLQNQPPQSPSVKKTAQQETHKL